MVYFSCNACGQSVKKNQVEKHYQFQCRNCEVLSCVDCGKDFRGEEYKSHIKCISEEAKYGAKDGKVSLNKGEVKQDQWFQNVQEKIATIKARPVLTNILQMILNFPNIPRKKEKFKKFLQNSVKLYDRKLIDEVWDIVSSSSDKANKAKGNDVNGDDAKDRGQKRKSCDETETPNTQEGPEFESVPLKKKKKKSAEKHDVECQDQNGTSTQKDEVDALPEKKHKKKKREEILETETDDTLTQTEFRKKKKKKSERERCNDEAEIADRRQDDSEMNREDLTLDGTVNEQEDSQQKVKHKKKKKRKEISAEEENGASTEKRAQETTEIFERQSQSSPVHKKKKKNKQSC